MNRREFLKSLFAAGCLTAIDVEKAIEQTLIDTARMTDDGFVMYLRYTMNMYVRNPAYCVRIDGIA